MSFNTRNLYSYKNKSVFAKPYPLQLIFGLNLPLIKQNKAKQDKAIIRPINNRVEKSCFYVELPQQEKIINYISKEKQWAEPWDRIAISSLALCHMRFQTRAQWLPCSLRNGPWVKSLVPIVLNIIILDLSREMRSGPLLILAEKIANVKDHYYIEEEARSLRTQTDCLWQKRAVWIFTDMFMAPVAKWHLETKLIQKLI